MVAILIGDLKRVLSNQTTLLVLAIVIAVPRLVCADESDQYLAWDHELTDAASTINAFINGKVREVLNAENTKPGASCDCENLTLEILPAIYLDRFRAPLVTFVENSEAISAYPNGVQAIRPLSIYRDVSARYLISVTRTIRVGDVYMGIDKLNHLVGIGRRYFVRYLSDRRSGLTDEIATENAIRWGIFTENSVLGTISTGVFSCADLEANYQGLLLARSFCEGDSPYLKRTNLDWHLTRDIDVREFVTPGFDESFYLSLYDDNVRPAVVAVLGREYVHGAHSQAVNQRFQKYRLVPPSTSMKIVQRYLVENQVTPHMHEVFEALHVNPEDPSAPLDPFNLNPIRLRTVVADR